MTYIEYVDPSYTPSETDLIALFRVEPARGITFEEAAGRVASESSNGTWTDIKTVKEHIKRLSARAYKINPPWVEIAYPNDLFEEGNMSQILSSIAGNIFGMKAIKKLRLEDVYWPKKIVEWFPGPLHGLEGVQDIMKIRDRPILATVPKPKVGMYITEYLEAAKEIWIGGIDLIKDDENLTGQAFSRFQERAEKMLKLRSRMENETGERKGYLINITAPYKEMVRRAELVRRLGGEFVMIDILTTGWAALQSIREEFKELKLAIHAHRAFHAAFTRDRRHGMSMKVVAEISRLLGVDHLHIGTVIGKLESPKIDVIPLIRICRDDEMARDEYYKVLPKRWYGVKRVFPVSSGGIHPGLVPKLIDMFGKDVIIQAGGGVVGHPKGPRRGGEALREAVEAAINGEDLDERARSSKPLQEALEYWGRKTPI
jgi:ribulose-bisphosphate carboxylase large chain